MFLLLPVAFVLIGLGVAGFSGLGPFSDRRRGAGTGWFGGMRAATALFIGLGIIGLNIVVGLVTFFALGQSDDGDARSRAPAPTHADTAPTTTPPEVSEEQEPATGVATSGEDPDAIDVEQESGIEVRTVTLGVLDPDAFPESYEVLDELAPDTLLKARVDGFEPFETGSVSQCTTGIRRTCGNRFGVQFDQFGTARFQYLMTDEFLVDADRMCRAADPECVLLVESTRNHTLAEIQTVFEDPVAPPGRITVSPGGPIDFDGGVVTVAVTDFSPGARVAAVVCAAPDDAGRDRCGRPGPRAEFIIAEDGTGTTELQVQPGRVGVRLASCERGDVCGIAVLSTDSSRAPVVPISFSAPVGTDYDGGQLALGLAIALVLLALAAWIVRSTDWRSPAEAAAPTIDESEFADLDAIIAGLEPEEVLAGRD